MSLSQTIEKTRKSIRKKYRTLQAQRMNETEHFEKIFQPIIEPLKDLKRKEISEDEIFEDEVPLKESSFFKPKKNA